MEKFSDQIKDWTTKVKAKNEKQCRAIALDLFARVVKATPVGKPWTWKHPPKPGSGYVGGRARGNWYVMLGKSPAVVDITDNKIDDASAAQAHVVRQLQKFNMENPVWLTNGLPYIHRLEYDSWSKQAPNGMVRVSMTEIGAIVRES